MQKSWHLLQRDPEAIQMLEKEAKIHPIIAHLLWNRQVRTPQQVNHFLHGNFKDVHPPQLMPGIQAATDKIWHFIQNRKKIGIFGDYDVDGTTGTAILKGILQLLDCPTAHHIPHRLEEGYGLNTEALSKLKKQGCDLVITVDCGITAINEAEHAKKIGLELIVTDHHAMKAKLPDAILVHPNLPNTTYPFAHISGSGVAYKLAWALAMKSCNSERVTPRLRTFLVSALCLAALGLVADVVPLIDENRIMVKRGIEEMNKNPIVGLAALRAKLSKQDSNPIVITDLQYKIGPLINVAGRLGYANLIVELLTTENSVRAKEIADHLESENTKRKFKQSVMLSEAKGMLAKENLNQLSAAVVYQPDWHPGIIGIVAAKLVEWLGRPVFVLSSNGESVTGSGRSIPGFPLHQVLEKCSRFLITSGGHEMAAGLKLKEEAIEPFREAFLAEAANFFGPKIPKRSKINIDTEIQFQFLDKRLMSKIDQIEPFGAGNERPIFMSTHLTIEGEPRLVGAEKNHVQFRVRQQSTVMKGIAFNMGDRWEELLRCKETGCSMVYHPTINSYNGASWVEITVLDFQDRPDPIIDSDN